MFLLLTLGFCLILPKVECKATFTNRIVGGDPVDISAVPYQLSLHYFADFICGAILIKPDVALTASHCVYKNNCILPPFGLIVYAGSVYRASWNSRRVTRIKSHPQFNINTLENDIAVLQLNKKLTITTAILPPLGFEVPVGNNVTVYGWGRTGENDAISPVLRAVTVKIVNQTKCILRYSSIADVKDTMLCAGLDEGGKDACYGDSGGPLIYETLLVGIVSWGLGCARPEDPGVYTKVSKFTEFIYGS